MRDAIEFFGAIIIGAGILFGIPIAAYVLYGSTAVKSIERDAPAWLEKQGFTVIGHEGFTYGVLSTPGGCVWYVMNRQGDPKTVYNGCVSRWHNGELQLYETKALNAVSGH